MVGRVVWGARMVGFVLTKETLQELGEICGIHFGCFRCLADCTE